MLKISKKNRIDESQRRLYVFNPHQPQKIHFNLLKDGNLAHTHTNTSIIEDPWLAEGSVCVSQGTLSPSLSLSLSEAPAVEGGDVRGLRGRS